ncbi:MAG: hypothetical protein K1X74_09830 [Pirellulales bacterium]|nr:hypothetical protein [Pirellulales bacterium]
MRWLHILAAITAVGGTLFMTVALHPVVVTLDEATRKTIQGQIRGRWAKFVHAAILGLLVSGLYNFFMLVRNYQVPSWYHMLWGIKFLIALLIFFIASSLLGRSARAERMRAQAGFWLGMNLSLAIAVVLISGVLRQAPRTPKVPAQPAPSAVPTASLGSVATPAPRILSTASGSIRLERSHAFAVVRTRPPRLQTSSRRWKIDDVLSKSSPRPATPWRAGWSNV